MRLNSLNQNEKTTIQIKLSLHSTQKSTFTFLFLNSSIRGWNKQNPTKQSYTQANRTILNIYINKKQESEEMHTSTHLYWRMKRRFPLLLLLSFVATPPLQIFSLPVSYFFIFWLYLQEDERPSPPLTSPLYSLFPWNRTEGRWDKTRHPPHLYTSSIRGHWPLTHQYPVHGTAPTLSQHSSRPLRFWRRRNTSFVCW